MKSVGRLAVGMLLACALGQLFAIGLFTIMGWFR